MQALLFKEPEPVHRTTNQKFPHVDFDVWLVTSLCLPPRVVYTYIYIIIYIYVYICIHIHIIQFIRCCACLVSVNPEES